MPPSRRRPVPSTPTGRPKVAGLRKRPETTQSPVSADPAAEEVQPAPFVEAVPETPDSPPATSDEPDPKPRPTGRRKRSGAPVPTAAEEPRRPVSKVAKESAEPGGLVLPIALVLVAAVLVGLGGWFQTRSGDVKYNEALVDSAGTTEVAGQVREAVEKSFSYNFADVAGTEKAANELLVGKAKCQYNAIFGPVKTLAPEQKLVVTVKAVSTGVTSLDGDRATVLLFLDQVTTRTTDNQSGGGIAMMRAGAQKLDGRWKVDNMEMFGAAADQSAALAKCD
ncbi:hypothetical protein ACQPW3_39330 [Actinosynnema sp. CA-248983]